MKDWSKLDDAICAHIKRGAGHPTNSAHLAALAMDAVRENELSAQVGWRVIDRRIQAMRKSGRLVLGRAGGSGCRWVVTHDT